MNRSAILDAALVVLPAFAGGDTRRKDMDDAAIVRHITQLEHEFAAATLRHDARALEQYVADDFVGVDVSGEHLGKAEILSRVASQEIELTTLRHEDISVRVYGDCAVVTARTVVAGHYKGEETGGEFPYMRVWIQRNGNWLAVATQSSAAPRR